MTWNTLTAALDAEAFAHLADDTAAVWRRQGAVLGTLSVMIDTVERPARPGGMALLERADVARISVAQAAAVAPGLEPAAGDTLTVAGRLRVIHGQPWRDEKLDGRDWLCPVNS